MTTTETINTVKLSFFRRWGELRGYLRRYPWNDWIVGFVLVWWAMDAFFVPKQVVYGSSFEALAAGIEIVRWPILIIGMLQVVSYYVSNRVRSWAAFMGSWAMLGLLFTVNSPTGKAAWGGHFISEFLLWLAVI